MTLTVKQAEWLKYKLEQRQERKERRGIPVVTERKTESSTPADNT